ncbi:hypothetical protein [Aureibacillus halotolerans]|uniref:hypothetical protein n=1 Tax=Aureibacillus halotolerans TaxID=1508390 RepID=UPI00105C8EEA|nr:hypothetical protein [Aureibacillus halotolerans]
MKMIIATAAYLFILSAVVAGVVDTSPPQNDNVAIAELSDQEQDIETTSVEMTSEKAEDEAAEQDAHEKAEQDAKKAEEESEQKAKEKAEAEKAAEEKRNAEAASALKAKAGAEANKTEKLENRIREIASEVWGDALIRVDYSDQGIQTRANIYFKLSDNFTKSMMISSAYLEILEVLEKTDSIQELDSISFGAQAEFIDQYGNDGMSSVLGLHFPKETRDKINFESIDYNNLPNLAEGVFIHPSF